MTGPVLVTGANGFVGRAVVARLAADGIAVRAAVRRPGPPFPPNVSIVTGADLELMARFFEIHHLRARYLPEVLVRMRTGGATNRSLRNIVRQNREIWRALHVHGLAGSMAGFFLGKLVSRGSQFVSRPPAP